MIEIDQKQQRQKKIIKSKASEMATAATPKAAQQPH